MFGPSWRLRSVLALCALTATAAGAAEGFHIRDGELLDAKDNPFMMRGTSVPFAWYDGDSYNALPSIAALKANTIRIAWLLNKSSSRLEQVMQKCIDLKMIPVPELHDATGKDDAGSLLACANYWAKPDVKAVLAKYRKQAIVNIANEWMGTWGKTSEWVRAYKEAIAIMRKAGITNTILIDAGGWGQDHTYVLNGALEVMASDTLKNVMFALHMYGQYGTAAKVQTAIRGIRAKDIPLVVGEFGWNHSDGNVDEAAILSECKAGGVGFLAWSWKGNGGGVEYLDLSSSWTSTTSLSDWGKTVFTSENGIGATSRTCTILTDALPGGTAILPLARRNYRLGASAIPLYTADGRMLAPLPGLRTVAKPATLLFP
jgi:mannan endo-1,4-beta-mannosidase